MTKAPTENLYTCVYWYGKSESDWLSFLSELTKENIGLLDKIYINTSLWGGQKLQKSTLEQSYHEMLNLHGKQKI